MGWMREGRKELLFGLVEVLGCLEMIYGGIG